jgi:RHS repeat-associated protein
VGNIESGPTESGYAYTGREWDPEINLYYYRARYYDPKIGRFISEDALVWAGVWCFRRFSDFYIVFFLLAIVVWCVFGFLAYVPGA